MPENEYPNYSASTVYSTGTYVLWIAADTHKVYQSLTGVTSTATISNGSPAVVTKVAHGLTADMPISWATTGSLPTGLTVGVVYYVKSPLTDSFNLAATVGGAAINTSSAGSGTHTYTASANYNIAVTDETKWLEVGNDNRWKCFDSSVTSQTTNADSIANVFHTVGRVDSVALLNIEAASVTITQTDAIDGVVYNQTYSLVDDSGISDWYAYFMEPISRTTDKVVTDLLPYANATVSVTLTETGGTAACGGMILGQAKDISYLNNSSYVGTELGMKLSIQDYSVKQRDVFGNYTILERAFNKRTDFTVYVDNGYVSALFNLLASYRATPVVYIGYGPIGATIVYGFYKDFSIDIAYHTKSICTISLEGLT